MSVRTARWWLPVTLLLAACDRDAPVLPRATLEVGALLGGADTLHARALEPRPFEFPADHGPHPHFRTEWWYFTGTLADERGQLFGYQLTFFRSALVDTAAFAAAVDTAGASAWRTRHAWMAHFAVSAAHEGRVYAAERFAREALQLAGAAAHPFHVHVRDWRADGSTVTFPVRLRAAERDIAVDLVLEQGKPVVLQGERGLSRKGAQPGNASYYYSLTRMPTSGTIRIGAQSYRVTGNSWFDREWSTSALAPGVAGWDWLALQLDDGTELMLYRLRRDDGSADPYSAGTIVLRDGASIHLDATEFSMEPRSSWQSRSGVRYPIVWLVTVPSRGLRLEVRAAFDAQELDLSVRYWEGMVEASGTSAGAAVAARGYLEMTGYAR